LKHHPDVNGVEDLMGGKQKGCSSIVIKKVISYISLALALVFLVNGIFCIFHPFSRAETGDSLNQSQNFWNNFRKSIDINDKYWITTNWNLAFALFLLMIFFLLRIRIRIVKTDDKKIDSGKGKNNGYTDSRGMEQDRESPGNSENTGQYSQYSGEDEESISRIHFTCPYCQHRIVSIDSMKGTRVQCPNSECRKRVKVPYTDERKLFPTGKTYSCILIIILLTLAMTFLILTSLGNYPEVRNHIQEIWKIP
jgi:hypothetical protein